MNDINETEIPIRELSAITGVNSVTIRAWERRYGLLKPKRTPKGHRLYTQEHIDTINEIKQHLNKGIAIGKVKELLEHQNESVEIDESWQAYSETLSTAIDTLNESRLEQVLLELTKHYPAGVLWEHLIQPLDNKYSASNDTFGAHSKYLLWHKVLRDICHLQIKKFTEKGAGTVIMVNLDKNEPSIEVLMLALQLLEESLQPNISYLESPLKEIPFVVQHTQAQSILLFGQGAINKQEVNREIAGRLGKLDLPLVVSGNTAKVNHSSFEELSIFHSTNHKELVSYLKDQGARDE